MYLSVWSFFEKYVLTVQCIHNAWNCTYIMVIEKYHSRMSHAWQYLISSQVLYGCTLNTDFLFDSRYWHAVDLRYKRNLLSCIWSMLDTLKNVKCDKSPVCERNFVGQCDDSGLTQSDILIQFNAFSLYLETI